MRAWLKKTPREPKKLFDGEGLYLTTTPAGTAVWRMRYRYAGVDRTLAFGTHEDIGLKGARDACDRAREQLQAGNDPSVVKKVERATIVAAAGTTFAECAAEWLKQRHPGWSRSHAKTVKETLERHVLPHLGPLPITAVSPAMVANVVERLGDRIDTALKVRQQCVGIFRLAMARGQLPHGSVNPADAAKEVIPRRRRQGHFPALTNWPALGELLAAARRAHLTPAVHQAHRLCAFTAARLGNVAPARWQHFDLEAGTWTIPRAEMKVIDRPFDHIVFLPQQIVAELKAWRALAGHPTQGYLFPSSNERGYVTHDGIEKVYRVTLGLRDQHTPHGWRVALSTLANDNGFDHDAVEIALDHVHDEKTVRAYDRGSRKSLRLELATWWGDQLAAAESAALSQAAK